MPIKVYEYSGCSTCKKALKYLDAMIKRPFLLTDKGAATGFQQEVWDELV